MQTNLPYRLPVFAFHGSNSLLELASQLHAQVELYDFAQAYTYRGIANWKFHSLPFLSELALDGYRQNTELNYVETPLFPEKVFQYKLIGRQSLLAAAVRKTIPFAQLDKSLYNLNVYRLAYANLYQNFPAVLSLEPNQLQPQYLGYLPATPAQSSEIVYPYPVLDVDRSYFRRIMHFYYGNAYNVEDMQALNYFASLGPKASLYLKDYNQQLANFDLIYPFKQGGNELVVKYFQEQIVPLSLTSLEKFTTYYPQRKVAVGLQYPTPQQTSTLSPSLALPAEIQEHLHQLAPYVGATKEREPAGFKALGSYLYFLELAALEQEQTRNNQASNKKQSKATSKKQKPALILQEVFPHSYLASTYLTQGVMAQTYGQLASQSAKIWQANESQSLATKLQKLATFNKKAAGKAPKSKQIAQLLEQALEQRQTFAHADWLRRENQYHHYVSWANQFGKLADINQLGEDHDFDDRRSKEFTISPMLASSYDTSLSTPSALDKDFYLLNSYTFATTSRLFAEYNHFGLTNPWHFVNPQAPVALTVSANQRLTLARYEVIHQDLRVTPLNAPRYLEDPLALAFEQIIYRTLLVNAQLRKDFYTALSPFSVANAQALGSLLPTEEEQDKQANSSVQEQANSSATEQTNSRVVEQANCNTDLSKGYPVQKLLSPVAEKLLNQQSSQGFELALEYPLSTWLQMFPQHLWHFRKAKEEFLGGKTQGQTFASYRFLGAVFYQVSVEQLPRVSYPYLQHPDTALYFAKTLYLQMCEISKTLPKRKSYDNLLMKSLYNRSAYLALLANHSFASFNAGTNTEPPSYYLRLTLDNLAYPIAEAEASPLGADFDYSLTPLYLDVFAQEVKLAQESSYQAKNAQARKQAQLQPEPFANYKSPQELLTSYNLPTTRWQNIASATLDPQVYTYDADPFINQLQFRNNLDPFNYSEAPLMRNASDLFNNYPHFAEFYERLHLDLTLTNSVFLASKEAVDGYFTTLGQELNDKLTFVSEQIRKAFVIPSLSERQQSYQQRDAQLILVPLPLKTKASPLEADLEVKLQKWQVHLTAQDYEQALTNWQSQQQLLAYPVATDTLELWFIYQLLGAENLPFVQTGLDQINLALFLKSLEPVVQQAYELSPRDLERYKTSFAQMFARLGLELTPEQMHEHLQSLTPAQLAEFIHAARMSAPLAPRAKTINLPRSLAWLKDLEHQGTPSNLAELVQALTVEEVELAIAYIAQLDGITLWQANWQAQQQVQQQAQLASKTLVAPHNPQALQTQAQLVVNQVDTFSAYLSPGLRLAPSTSYPLLSMQEVIKQELPFATQMAFCDLQYATLEMPSLEQFAQSQQAYLWQTILPWMSQEQQQILTASKYQLEQALTQTLFTPGQGTRLYLTTWKEQLIKLLNIKGETALALRCLSQHPSRVFADSLGILYPQQGYRASDALVDGLFSRFHIFSEQDHEHTKVATLTGELELGKLSAPLLNLWQQSGLTSQQLAQVLATSPETAGLLEKQRLAPGFANYFRAYLYFGVLPQLLATPVFNLEQMQQQLDKAVEFALKDQQQAAWLKLEMTTPELVHQAYAYTFNTLSELAAKPQEGSKILAQSIGSQFYLLNEQNKIEPLKAQTIAELEGYFKNVYYPLNYDYPHTSVKQMSARSLTLTMDPKYLLFKGYLTGNRYLFTVDACQKDQLQKYTSRNSFDFSFELETDKPQPPLPKIFDLMFEDFNKFVKDQGEAWQSENQLLQEPRKVGTRHYYQNSSSYQLHQVLSSNLHQQVLRYYQLGNLNVQDNPLAKQELYFVRDYTNLGLYNNLWLEIDKINFIFNSGIKEASVRYSLPLYMPLADNPEVVLPNPAYVKSLTPTHIAQFQQLWQFNRQFLNLDYYKTLNKQVASDYAQLIELIQAQDLNLAHFYFSQAGEKLYQLFLSQTFAEREVARNLVYLEGLNQVPQALYLPARPLHLLYATSEESGYHGEQSQEIIATFKAHAQILQQKLFNALLRQYDWVHKYQNLPRAVSSLVTLPFESLTHWRVTITKAPFYSATLNQQALHEFVAHKLLGHQLQTQNAEHLTWTGVAPVNYKDPGLLEQALIYHQLKGEQFFKTTSHSQLQAFKDKLQQAYLYLQSQAPDFVYKLNFHACGIDANRFNEEQALIQQTLSTWAYEDLQAKYYNETKAYFSTLNEVFNMQDLQQEETSPSPAVNTPIVSLDDEEQELAQMLESVDFARIAREQDDFIQEPNYTYEEYAFTCPQTLAPTLGWEQEPTSKDAMQVELALLNFQKASQVVTPEQVQPKESKLTTTSTSINLRELYQLYLQGKEPSLEQIYQTINLFPYWSFKDKEINAQSFKQRCHLIAKVLLHQLSKLNNKTKALSLEELNILFKALYRQFMQIKVMLVADYRLLEEISNLDLELRSLPYLYFLPAKDKYLAWVKANQQEVSFPAAVLYHHQSKASFFAQLCNELAQAQAQSLEIVETTNWYPYLGRLRKFYA
ncbi:hypothetical protein [Psittacicella gerlachiana]|uniref:Uncharacterized protein n=1 Tax=Psittacicella gerlachiana TaxID=2028574 RepID=A0A3A1YM13_9GAMM|nr:hypothetical protein [Psittacicella gerlachiana]RIY38506.1 hypothetical protein CKF59_00790 [Psittacicella gerlachiana]